MADQDKTNGRNDAHKGNGPRNTHGMHHKAANDYHTEYLKQKGKK